METFRILVVTSKFPRFEGDTQPGFVYSFVEAIKNLGNEVAVVAPHDRKAKKFEVMNDVMVHRFQYFWPASKQRVSYGAGIPANVQGSLLTKLQFPMFAASEIALTRKISKQFKPDFVHAHWALPQGLAAKLTGKPYFVTMYGGEVFMSKRFKLITLLDYVVRKSKKTFVITRGMEQVMREYGVKSRVEILPVGLDVTKFYPNYPGAGEIKKKYGLNVFFVGRHVEKKGIKYLIEAFAKVVKEIPGCKLLVGGAGPLTEELKALTSSLGLQGNVEFLGSVSVEDLPKYYAAADLFVAPSIIDRVGDRETQGVVLLEAMASKTAVIGTDTGGIPDVISNGEVGILVPEKDSDALAKEMIRLLQNKGMRDDYAEAGHNHVRKNFTWEAIAKKYMRAYKNSL
jgi:glycosyltransferase involved in cell wall biosynthesis